MSFERKGDNKNLPPPKDNLPRVSSNLKALEKFPSRGLFYPKDILIRYRPYTLGEVKRISKSKNATPREELEEVLSGVESNIGTEGITVGDALYLGLLRKLSTIGSTTITISYKCGICENTGKHVFDTNKISFDELFEDKSKEEIPIPLPVKFEDGSELNFSPLTVGQYYEMLEHGVEDDTLAKLAFEAGGDWEENLEKFESFTSKKDIKVLKTLDGYLYHSTSPVKFKCGGGKGGCGKDVEIELDGGRAILLPFRTHNPDIEDRICFNAKS